MKFIADFHIHSHYSRATSKELVPEYLHYWARIKGITIIGSGDFTHPGWIQELKEKLEPVEDGLFKLKPEYLGKELSTPFLAEKEVRFMLTAEISNIYKKNERVRKVHNVIFAPDFAAVERIQQKLTAINANITSDGRPILGLDSRDLLEMVLDADERCFFIPAHIWTPWFSVLGSKSGFDSVSECFDDLSDHIYAVETGLSTDPPMNWMCSFLDNYTLTANSDAHSPERLGRNANRFDTELSYRAITHALKTGDPGKFLGSIDLFPQEGKYHYDGHRKCGICWDPVETLKHNGICSVCGKPVTVGVMNRVVQLSDRENLEQRPGRHPFQSIIPLKEMLGELANVGPNSKKVDRSYMDLIKKGVSEMELLLETPLEEINSLGGGELADAVFRMRSRKVYIQEGFDGQYGVIKVFAKGERPGLDFKNCLFKEQLQQERQMHVPPTRKLINFSLDEFRRLVKVNAQNGEKPQDKVNSKGKLSTSNLNSQQQAAVEHYAGPALVLAGPGTGKTHVLTYRILQLIEHREINPAHILAITFTNKAAMEINQRLKKLLKKKNLDTSPCVTTFHALGYSILKELLKRSGVETAFSILEPEDKKRILQKISGIDQRRIAGFSNIIETAKQQLKTPHDLENENPEAAGIFNAYCEYLEERKIYDLADLLYIPARLFIQDPEFLNVYRDKFKWVLVDEYQDVNYAQYKLLRSLQPGMDSNLYAIGDPDQAIYGFRGADVRFIQRFQEDYPEAVLYRLKKSYRCSDSILRASGNVMQRDSNHEALLSGLEAGIKIKIVKNNSHKSEAEFVARTIEQMMGGLRFFSMDSDITEGNKETEIDSLSDFVVLCRIKGQMEAMEKAFIDHSIPYQIVGEEPFFKQEPVCSLIDLLKLGLNPQNTILKEKLIEKKIITPLETGSLQLPQYNRDNQDNRNKRNSVKDIVAYLYEKYFGNIDWDSVKMHTTDASPSLKEDIESRIKRLLDLASDFGEDLDGFVQFTSLGTAVDMYRPDTEQVTLMTLHGAKGLEFKAVFITGCEEGLLPYSLFHNREADVEEERRLLYVGMTRAKRFLFLSHAEKRFLLGREYRLPRSSFLNRIERELIELSQQERKRKETDGAVQRTLFDIK